MLCERCKIREANIQYTEIVNGVMHEHNFCMQCAKEMNFGEYSSIFDGGFPLGKLLSGLLGDDNHEKYDKMRGIECPKCHMTYGEFIEKSCFGCEECYDTFDILVRDNIKKLQGSDQYRGMGLKMKPQTRAQMSDKNIDKELGLDKKKPGVKAKKKLEKTMAIREEIKLLKQQLNDAIADEDFETAAVCRDKINELKKGDKDV